MAKEKKEIENNETNKNGKKKKKGKLGCLTVLLLIAIAVLILLRNGGFGFGFGEKGNGTGKTSETSANETAAVTEADGKVIITISDGVITVEGSNYADAAALKEYLLSVNDDTVSYVLYDNHAIKSVYDEVKAVLDELKYNYTEKVSE